MPDTQRATWRGAALFVAKALVAAALLGWLVERGLLDIRQLLKPGALPLHLLAVGLQFGGVVVQSVRWRLLLERFAIRIRVRDAVVVSLIGLFGSLVLPGGLGLEVIRALYVARSRPGRAVASSVSVLLDRFIGLYGFLLLGCASLAWQTASAAPGRAFAARLLPFVATPFFAMTVVLAAPWSATVRAVTVRAAPRRVREQVEACLVAYAAAPLITVAAIGMSIAASAIVAATFLIAATLAGAATDWTTVVAVAPLVVIAAVLPITPQGLGVAEASAAALFAGFGVSGGATIALAVRLWTIVLCVPGGLLYVVRHTELAEPPERRPRE